jgi:hypothetical protein
MGIGEWGMPVGGVGMRSAGHGVTKTDLALRVGLICSIHTISQGRAVLLHAISATVDCI